MELYLLIEYLEASVKKNGKDKVLTLGHLLNLLKMVERHEEKDGDATLEDTF